jgi:hypothetical protein
MARRAFDVFESVMWENGFFGTSRLKIVPPLVFPCDPRAKAVMIYPGEGTNGNRVYDSAWWLDACRLLRERGWSVHHLGRRDHPPLADFYRRFTADREFEPTIDGLRCCAAGSSLAIGASTGPTWALLFSDIPQIVLEARQSPHSCWFFERCQRVLAKKLRIYSTLESLLV